MTRNEANPTPSVLAWARESAGMSVELSAKKATVNADRLAAWESGEQRPSFAQLRKLASIYKRPLAVFYLESPPVRFEAMHDFRRIAESEGAEPSPELTLEVRKAHDRREWALELYEGLGESFPQISGSLSVGDDPEAAASTVRSLLGVTLEQQANWRTQYQAFREWRLLIENAGILTFQATGVDLNEARGFSIAERPLPVAEANIKDAPRGRIFTLLHELAHILFSDGGICDLHETGSSELSTIETFCNRIAGATIFLYSAIMESDAVRRHRKGDTNWTDDELAALSRQFGGSREAALVRLLALGLTTQRFYSEKRG